MNVSYGKFSLFSLREADRTAAERRCAEVLPRVSHRVYAPMAQDAPPNSGTAIEGSLPIECLLCPAKGSINPRAVCQLWPSRNSDAPSRLFEAPGSRLALPGLSLGRALAPASHQARCLTAGLNLNAPVGFSGRLRGILRGTYRREASHTSGQTIAIA